MNINELKVDFAHTTKELELILAGLRKLPMELVQELHDRIITTANAAVAAQLSKVENAEQTTEN